MADARLPVGSPPVTRRSATPAVESTEQQISQDQPDVWRNQIGRRVEIPVVTRKANQYNPQDPWWQFKIGTWAVDRTEAHLDKYRGLANPRSALEPFDESDMPTATGTNATIDLAGQKNTSIVLQPPNLKKEVLIKGHEARLAWTQDGEFGLTDTTMSQDQIAARASRYVTDIKNSDVETAQFNDGLKDMAHLGNPDLEAAKRRLDIDLGALAPRIQGMLPSFRLYDHQVIGVDRLVTAHNDGRTQGHLVADDVGLGKSAEAVAALLHVSSPTGAFPTATANLVH